VVAAGSGSRLGAGVPKAFVPLAGRPMIAWSLDVLAASDAIGEIVVALPPEAGAGDAAEMMLPDGVTGVPGGAERSHSVRAAFDAAQTGGELVLVHDAARPLVTAETIGRVLEAAGAPGVDAAVAAAPVTDTVKEAGEDRVVTRTLDRSTLWAVQTPQAFRRDALARALDAPRDVLAAATDDASLVESAGGRVVVVPSPAENLKVTTPLDLRVAELLLAERA
jgi:2-C-methyl-D-erythritol 4-phosphate cytidylyltransferase